MDTQNTDRDAGQIQDTHITAESAEAQNPLQTKIDPKIVSVIATLQNNGYTAYIVGGAVRDFLLDRTPKDYDLATSATPEQVRKVFGKKKCMIIGRRFRLVHLYLGRDRIHDIVEISTFRRRPDPDDQHPREGSPDHMIMNDNEYGTAEDDAGRRDFTVNALFYDPVHDQLLDYTGSGKSDVENGIVRSIGNPALRFEEDPVRILRALKLVGQYGFTLEEETEKALRKCMPMIQHASVARLTLELEKLFRNPYGANIMETFRNYGFLQYFLPYWDARFDTPAGQYVLALWKLRDERVRAKIYRPSLSLALSLYCLPFMEEYFGSKPGELWKHQPEIHMTLRGMLRDLLAPHTIMRIVGTNTVSHLCLQLDFYHGTKTQDATRGGYASARELAILQNTLMWHREDFEAQHPPLNLPNRKKRKRRKKKNSGEDKNRHKPERGKTAVLHTLWNTITGLFGKKKKEQHRPAPKGGKRKRGNRRRNRRNPAGTSAPDAAVSSGSKQQ